MTSIITNQADDLTNNNNSNVFLRFIQSSSIADVINKVKPDCQEVIDLPYSSTIEEAFDVLLAEDILSVPIYYKHDNEKKYIAIVSALDLLKLLSTKVSLDTLNNNSDALLVPLSEAIGHTEHLTILKSTDSLQDLLKLFSYQRTHRVLIEHQSNVILISQMDLIKFFQSNNHQLGSFILDMQIKDINSSVVKVKLNYKCTAAEAFLKLAVDNTASALPIIDDNEDLIGEISPQDLRGLNRNRWDSLLKPIVMFLKSSHGDLYPPFTCHDRFTLSQVMTSLVLHKTNRLWWVDYETTELKGIITLTDILSTFASYC